MEIDNIKHSSVYKDKIIAYKVVKKYGDKIWGPSQMIFNQKTSLAQIYTPDDYFFVRNKEDIKVDHLEYDLYGTGQITGCDVTSGFFYFYKNLDDALYYVKSDETILECQLFEEIGDQVNNTSREKNNIILSTVFQILNEIVYNFDIPINVGDSVMINNRAAFFDSNIHEFIDKNGRGPFTVEKAFNYGGEKDTDTKKNFVLKEIPGCLWNISDIIPQNAISRIKIFGDTEKKTVGQPRDNADDDHGTEICEI